MAAIKINNNKKTIMTRLQRWNCTHSGFTCLCMCVCVCALEICGRSSASWRAWGHAAACLVRAAAAFLIITNWGTLNFTSAFTPTPSPSPTSRSLSHIHRVAPLPWESEFFSLPPQTGTNDQHRHHHMTLPFYILSSLETALDWSFLSTCSTFYLKI